MTDRTPRVSVVIPSYNHERYVEAAARSALTSCDDLELVVVDDGSTDSSREILQGIDDPRVRLEFQENQGAHAALARGIELSQGEIVFLLNSDDLFHIHRIPHCLEVFDRLPNTVLVASWLEIIDGSDSPLGVKKGWHNLPPWPRPHAGPGLADTHQPLLAMLEQNYISTTSNLALRRSAYFNRDLTFAPLRYTHDWDFILSACQAPLDLVVLDSPLVHYRVHGKNTIAEGKDKSIGPMRLEILWTVARHAHRIERLFPGHLPHLWRSLPDFGQPGILAQLLSLRGTGDDVPAVYDDLLTPQHPWRERAERLLAES